MTQSNRKPLIVLAVLAALAAPVAFAQSSQSDPQSATPATPAEPATPPGAQDSATAQSAQPATPATPATPAKKNWSELDADKNGTLNQTEVASIESLSRDFVQADTNADGELTQDEYKAYLAANGQTPTESDAGTSDTDSGG